MKVGFTGSRNQPTEEQVGKLGLALIVVGATELHHGDCVGSDAAAHNVARNLGLRVVVHPPINDNWRAFCVPDEIRPEYEYLDRNRHIVEDTDLLIALPDGPERKRSGTWSTIRYAHSLGRQVVMWLP